jgi:hypothetical protein
MENIIDLAMTHVVCHIPPQILQRAFPALGTLSGLPVSTHEQILQQIIHNRELKDCNLVGGRGKYINILPEYLESTQDQMALNPLAGYNYHFSLHRIPPAARDGMRIGQVSEVLPMSLGQGSAAAGIQGYGMNTTLAGLQVLNSITQEQYRSPPLAEVVSGDMIRLTPAQFSGLGWTLVCTLHYDHDFTGMNGAAMLPFCAMVVAAVQAHIFNTMYLALDQGFIQHGADYPGLRSIIEGYAGANEVYAEARKKFLGMARFDPIRMMRLHQFGI